MEKEEFLMVFTYHRTLKSIHSLNQISYFSKNLPEWNSVSGWKFLKNWEWNLSHSPWRTEQDRDGSQSVDVETQQHPNHHNSTAQRNPHFLPPPETQQTFKICSEAAPPWMPSQYWAELQFTMFISQRIVIWVSVQNWIVINSKSNQRGGKQGVWERSLGERNCTAFLCNM